MSLPASAITNAALDDPNALLRNALSSRSLQSLMPNLPVNRTFAITLGRDVKAQNQAQSGRCWIFANINSLRRVMVKRYGWASDFTLSPAFVYFYALMEQCNTALEISHEQAGRGVRLGSCEYLNEVWRPTDGGDVHAFMALLQKYGACPRELYPDTQPAQHSAIIGQTLRNMLHAAAIEILDTGPTSSPSLARAQFDALKLRVLKSVHRTLSAFLGRPPTRFRFVPRLAAAGGSKAFEASDPVFQAGGKTMGKSKGVGNSGHAEDLTPLQFFDKYVSGVMESGHRVHVCNDPRHPLNTWVAPQRSVVILAPSTPSHPPHLRHIDNLVGNLFWNMGPRAMKAATLKSLSAGRPVIFACDVSKFYNPRIGFMGKDASSVPRLFPGSADAWEMASQPATHARAMNADIVEANHEMTFIGMDAETDTWEVENSWGAVKPITMSGAWFDRFVYSVCVLDTDLSTPERRHLNSVGRATMPTEANASANGMPLDELNRREGCGASGNMRGGRMPT